MKRLNSDPALKKKVDAYLKKHKHTYKDLNKNEGLRRKMMKELFGSRSPRK